MKPGVGRDHIERNLQTLHSPLQIHLNPLYQATREIDPFLTNKGLIHLASEKPIYLQSKNASAPSHQR